MTQTLMDEWNVNEKCQKKNTTNVYGKNWMYIWSLWIETIQIFGCVVCVCAKCRILYVIFAFDAAVQNVSEYL